MRGRELRQALLVGFLLVVAFWLLSLIVGLVGKAKIAVGEANEVRREYDALAVRRATLEASLGALETERGEDAAIRTAFGVARPGEEVIVVVPPATTSATTTKSWWEALWDWF